MVGWFLFFFFQRFQVTHQVTRGPRQQKATILKDGIPNSRNYKGNQRVQAFSATMSGIWVDEHNK